MTCIHLVYVRHARLTMKRLKGINFNKLIGGFFTKFLKMRWSARCAILASVVFAVVPSGPASAQCADVSKLDLAVCTVKECKARHDRVHKTCDVPRSCRSFNLSKAELVRRLNLNQSCKAVRLHVAECFKTAHKGHSDAIDDAQNAIDTCAFYSGH